MNEAWGDLKKREELLRNVLDGILVFAGLASPDGTVITANRASLERAGLNIRDVLNRPLPETYWWSYSDSVKMQLCEAIKKANRGVPSNYDVKIRVGENDFMIADFNLKPLFDNSGKVTYLVASGIDITDRKRSEEALQESEEKYRTLFENTGAPTFVVEEDTTFSLTNAEFIKQFGYTKGELEGKTWTKFVPQYELKRLEGYHRLRRIDPAAAPKNIESKFIDARGNSRDILLSVGLIPGTKKNIGSLIDITELKQTQKKLKKLNEELEIRVEKRTKELEESRDKLIATERLAILGHFSGSISHELRNPLGVIDSSVYYLKQTMKDMDPKVLQHLDRIEKQVKHSTAIIESLLDLTRLRKKPLNQKFDLIPAVNDVLTAAKMPHGVRVTRDIPDEKIYITGDSRQLRITFGNIIKNAVEAMGGEGTLKVRMESAEKEGVVKVVFTDTGSGIAPENLTKIFQPLFSTRAKGIGFGLSICQQIIDQHGGRIEVKSEPNKGASFEVKIPLNQ